MIEDCPRPRGQLEDKMVVLAMDSAWSAGQIWKTTGLDINFVLDPTRWRKLEWNYCNDCADHHDDDDDDDI